VITRFELTVRPARKLAALPADHGRQVKAFAYGWLKAGDKELSATAHAGGGGPPNPFTCSLLLGAPEAQDGAIALTGERQYSLYVTALTPQAAHAFDAGIASLRGRLSLAALPFDILDVFVATRAEYAELLGPPQGRTWLLRFLSPTSFTKSTAASEKTTILLPMPRLIFQSLAWRWNAFAPEALPRVSDAFVDAMEQGVHVSAIAELRTEPRGGPTEARGFMGEVELALLARLGREDVALMSALLRCAEYAGVGGRTAEGRGRVEVRLVGGPSRRPADARRE
jgi:CRISPR-associated endoribonuclease Cas6